MKKLLMILCILLSTVTIPPVMASIYQPRLIVAQGYDDSESFGLFGPNFTSDNLGSMDYIAPPSATSAPIYIRIIPNTTTSFYLIPDSFEPISKAYCQFIFKDNNGQVSIAVETMKDSPVRCSVENNPNDTNFTINFRRNRKSRSPSAQDGLRKNHSAAALTVNNSRLNSTQPFLRMRNNLSGSSLSRG